MPYASMESRRAHNAVYYRRNAEQILRRRRRMIPDYAVGGDDDWLIVTCHGCAIYFDVPRRGSGRRPMRCEDCR